MVRKLNAVRNIKIAPRLPIAEAFGEKDRNAISSNNAISTMPSAREKFRVSSIAYPHDRSGMFTAWL
jgi:hypothetical protein